MKTSTKLALLLSFLNFARGIFGAFFGYDAEAMEEASKYKSRTDNPYYTDCRQLKTTKNDCINLHFTGTQSGLRLLNNPSTQIPEFVIKQTSNFYPTQHSGYIPMNSSSKQNEQPVINRYELEKSSEDFDIGSKNSKILTDNLTKGTEPIYRYNQYGKTQQSNYDSETSSSNFPQEHNSQNHYIRKMGSELNYDTFDKNEVYLEQSVTEMDSTELINQNLHYYTPPKTNPQLSYDKYRAIPSQEIPSSKSFGNYDEKSQEKTVFEGETKTKITKPHQNEGPLNIHPSKEISSYIIYSDQSQETETPPPINSISNTEKKMGEGEGENMNTENHTIEIGRTGDVFSSDDVVPIILKAGGLNENKMSAEEVYIDDDESDTNESSETFNNEPVEISKEKNEIAESPNGDPSLNHQMDKNPLIVNEGIEKVDESANEFTTKIENSTDFPKFQVEKIPPSTMINNQRKEFFEPNPDPSINYKDPWEKYNVKSTKVLSKSNKEETSSSIETKQFEFQKEENFEVDKKKFSHYPKKKQDSSSSSITRDNFNFSSNNPKDRFIHKQINACGEC